MGRGLAGWNLFRLIRLAPMLRTDRETSQASREALESWALGLESTVL